MLVYPGACLNSLIFKRDFFDIFLIACEGHVLSSGLLGNLYIIVQPNSANCCFGGKCRLGVLVEQNTYNSFSGGNHSTQFHLPIRSYADVTGESKQSNQHLVAYFEALPCPSLTLVTANPFTIFSDRKIFPRS